MEESIMYMQNNSPETGSSRALGSDGVLNTSSERHHRVPRCSILHLIEKQVVSMK